MKKSILNSNLLSEVEEPLEISIRPKFLSEFTGQKASCDNLKIFINAAKSRKDPLDHTLLFGPPGLGKTTLAQIIANEMEVDFRATSGPILAKAGDLAALLTNLTQHSVFFIDEIHRLNPAVEETLYSAMEDFKIDVMIGEGPSAKTIRLDLPRFTLVGATTRSGLLAQPFRERFGIPIRLKFYESDDLAKVIKRAARILNMQIDDAGAFEIARRARGTPRIAVRLLRRVRDFSSLFPEKRGIINIEIANYALEKLEVDDLGLDSQDIRYIRAIADYYNGGPVGLDTISAAIGEEKDTLEEIVEPYLLQQGFIQRTPRGRILTSLAYRHLNLVFPQNNISENDKKDC